MNQRKSKPNYSYDFNLKPQENKLLTPIKRKEFRIIINNI